MLIVAATVSPGNAVEPVPRMLCVDDEPQLLEGIAAHVRPYHAVDLAGNGRDGFDLLRQHPDINIIVSDMRMPGMSGAEFLAASRLTVPDARRILLTGFSDTAATLPASCRRECGPAVVGTGEGLG